MKLEGMTNEELERAASELKRRQEAAHEEYRERTYYQPRREAMEKMVTDLTARFKLSEDEQSDIYYAWREFYEKWG